MRRKLLVGVLAFSLAFCGVFCGCGRDGDGRPAPTDPSETQSSPPTVVIPEASPDPAETLSDEDRALAELAAEALWDAYDLPGREHFRPDVRRHVSNGTVRVVFDLYIGRYDTRESYRAEFSADGRVVKTSASFEGEYSRYLTGATPEAIAAAESGLAGQLAAYGQSASYGYLTIDEAGYLCLSAEVIVELDQPFGGIFSEGGCGVDHEHVFLRERICGAEP